MNTPKIKRGTIEAIKTVLIAVLITGLLAFIGGMQYQKHQQAEVQKAVKAVQAQAVESPPLK
jgi:hypothetical protein